MTNFAASIFGRRLTQNTQGKPSGMYWMTSRRLHLPGLRLHGEAAQWKEHYIEAFNRLEKMAAGPHALDERARRPHPATVRAMAVVQLYRIHISLMRLGQDWYAFRAVDWLPLRRRRCRLGSITLAALQMEGLLSALR